MKTKTLKIAPGEPLFSMLERSAEKKWGYIEIGLYSLVMLAAVVAIMQFNLQPDLLPISSLPNPIGPA